MVFSIHFPITVPGPLQLEALAQMLTVAIATLPGNKGKVTCIISRARFRKKFYLNKNL